MADYDPYGLNGFHDTARTIAQGLQQMPRAAAMGRENRAREGLLMAQTATASQEAEALRRKGEIYAVIESESPQAMLDIQAGRLDTPAVRKMVGAVSVLSGEKPQSIWQGLGQVIQQGGAMAAKDPTAMHTATFGRALPPEAAVTDAQRQDVIASRNARAKMQADSRVDAARVNAERPIALPTDRMLVTPEGNVLNPGAHNLRIGERLFGPGAVGLQLGTQPLAEGAPGREVWSATPGSALVNRTGQIVGQVPSVTNPTQNLSPMLQVELKALGEGLANAIKTGDSQTASNLVQQIRALGAQPAAGSSNPSSSTNAPSGNPSTPATTPTPNNPVRMVTAPMVAPDGEPLVRMLDANGGPVRVRQSQVQAAIRDHGFTLKQ
jgi:hypothetical protein